jgi:hypothetical protein
MPAAGGAPNPTCDLANDLPTRASSAEDRRGGSVLPMRNTLLVSLQRVVVL